TLNRIFNQLKKNNMVVSQSDTLTNPDYKSGTLYIPHGHWEEVKWMSAGFMKADLALQIWGIKKRYPIINDVFDNTVEKAQTMWGEVNQLREYASTHTKAEKIEKE